MFLPVRVAPRVDTEFPYRVRIVDRGVECRDLVCRHRFRFLENKRFLLVNRLVAPGLTAFSKSLCVKSLCAFFLSDGRDGTKGLKIAC